MTKNSLPEKTSRRHWVQTERVAHEAWANLLRQSPRAAELLHLLVARVGDHNAVVISQKTLAQLMGRNRRTVIRATQDLVVGKWIEVRQIGDRGTVNAYILNDRVAWTKARDDLRYSLFSANVIIAEEEQPDREILENQDPIRKLPRIGEIQNPIGDGLPPPTQPSLPGMEPVLPATGLVDDPQ